MLRGLRRVFAKKRSKETPYFPVTSASDLLRIRNVGVIAHIDAGKTTVTERMLYYCGALPAPGNVDDGTTVMDYMEQERSRGITIRAAAITFTWGGFHFNLIDTPGHVDFSGEVERSLRVMDGAVVVLDSSRGVQPQTETVWLQSHKYHVPRVLFLNKMDLKGASLDLCLHDLTTRLKVLPLVLQLPIGRESAYTGNVDLVTMQAITYIDHLGTQIDMKPVSSDYPDKRLYESALKHREALIDQVASLDDHFADLYLAGKYTNDDLKLAIRNITVNLRAFPIFCGTALRNKGVQMLLDGVVDYLASPGEIPPVHCVSTAGEEVLRMPADKQLCSLAFKVMANTEKGPLVYLRLYSGKLKIGQMLRNTSQAGLMEKATRLYRVRAKEYVEVEEVTAGDVVAVAGLAKTKSGDTLLDKGERGDLLLPGLTMPPPVFFCSISSDSDLSDKKLEEIMGNLIREDPSLLFQHNEESGQHIVLGLGELHLEILRDRLWIEYGLKVRLGPVRVAYRESVQRTFSHTITLDKPELREFFTLKIKVEKTGSQEDSGAKIQELMQRQSETDSIIKWELADLKDCLASRLMAEVAGDRSKREELLYDNEEPQPLQKISKELKDEITRSLQDSLRRGPVLGYPLLNVAITVEDGMWYRSRMNRRVAVECCSKAVPEALGRAGPVVLEPIMAVEVVVPNLCLGETLNDIAASRRGIVLDTKKDALGEKNQISAKIPLVELIGYSTSLRSLSKGEASFLMSFDSYRPLDSEGLAQLKASGL